MVRTQVYIYIYMQQPYNYTMQYPLLNACDGKRSCDLCADQKDSLELWYIETPIYTHIPYT